MEMKCVVCDKSIPKGHRFIGDRYKDKKFCSEECYNQYCKEKDEEKQKAKIETIKRNLKKKEKEKSPWRKMTDYIDSLYPEDAINWPMFTKQIKSAMEDYGLTCDEIRLIIKFAIEFDNYKVKPEYGIGQFIPCYIEPTKRFREQIANNRLAAKTTTGEIPVWNIKRPSNARKFYGKVEDFDE